MFTSFGMAQVEPAEIDAMTQALIEAQKVRGCSELALWALQAWRHVLLYLGALEAGDVTAWRPDTDHHLMTLHSSLLALVAQPDANTLATQGLVTLTQIHVRIARLEERNNLAANGDVLAHTPAPSPT